MADQVCKLKSRAILARGLDEMIVYPQLMLPVPAHSLAGVSVVCFDASDWGQSPAPALRALSERSRSQLRGRSQSPSHQSVSSGQWRGRGDIIRDASHVWLDICLAVQRQSIRNCSIPWLRAVTTTFWLMIFMILIVSIRHWFLKNVFYELKELVKVRMWVWAWDFGSGSRNWVSAFYGLCVAQQNIMVLLKCNTIFCKTYLHDSMLRP